MPRWTLVVGLLLVSSTAVAGTLPAADLEALRTAGTTEIAPDDATLASVPEGGDLVTELKVCLTRKGKVRSVKILESSGFAAYDRRIKRTVKKTWRFRPYKRKRKAVAVCARAVVSYPLACEGCDGVEGGEVGGVLGGVVTAPPPPPPPPPPPRVETVAPSALEGNRISGDKNIVPDDDTKAAIASAGTKRVVVPVKLCVDEAGKVRSAQVLKASAYDAYDAKIVATIRTWTYQPFLVDGVATAVCSAITFIYVTTD